MKADRNYFLCNRDGCEEGKPCKVCRGEAELNDDPRTVREFVEEMLLAGRCDEMILAVATACRWNSYIQEIKEILKQFSGILKKEVSNHTKSTIIDTDTN